MKRLLPRAALRHEQPLLDALRLMHASPQSCSSSVLPAPVPVGWGFAGAEAGVLRCDRHFRASLLRLRRSLPVAFAVECRQCWGLISPR